MGKLLLPFPDNDCLRVLNGQRTPYANEPPRIRGHFFNYLDDVELSLAFLGQRGGSRTGGFAPDAFVKYQECSSSLHSPTLLTCSSRWQPAHLTFSCVARRIAGWPQRIPAESSSGSASDLVA